MNSERTRSRTSSSINRCPAPRMSLLVSIMDRAISNIRPHLASAYYTGNSQDAIVDFAAILVLAENWNHLVHVDEEKLRIAAECVCHFLENIDYTETFMNEISIDVERFRRKVIARARERKGRRDAKRRHTYPKSKIRRLREKVINAGRAENSDDEMLDFHKETKKKNGIPPFCTAETLLPDAAECSSGEEAPQSVDLCVVLDRRLVSYYKRTHNQTPPPSLSKGDILLLTHVILHGLECAIGPTKSKTSTHVIPLDDTVEFEASYVFNCSKIASLMSAIYENGLRRTPQLYSEEMYLENISAFLSQMSTVALEIANFAVQSGEVPPVAAKLTSPIAYVRTFHSMVHMLILKGEQLPADLEETVTDWWQTSTIIDDEKCHMTRNFMKMMTDTGMFVARFGSLPIALQLFHHLATLSTTSEHRHLIADALEDCIPLINRDSKCAECIFSVLLQFSERKASTEVHYKALIKLMSSMDDTYRPSETILVALRRLTVFVEISSLFWILALGPKSLYLYGLELMLESIQNWIERENVFDATVIVLQCLFSLTKPPKAEWNLRVLRMMLDLIKKTEMDHSSNTADMWQVILNQVDDMLHNLPDAIREHCEIEKYDSNGRYIMLLRLLLSEQTGVEEKMAELSQEFLSLELSNIQEILDSKPAQFFTPSCSSGITQRLEAHLSIMDLLLEHGARVAGVEQALTNAWNACLYAASTQEPLVRRFSSIGAAILSPLSRLIKEETSWNTVQSLIGMKDKPKNKRFVLSLAEELAKRSIRNMASQSLTVDKKSQQSTSEESESEQQTPSHAFSLGVSATSINLLALRLSIGIALETLVDINPNIEEDIHSLTSCCRMITTKLEQGADVALVDASFTESDAVQQIITRGCVRMIEWTINCGIQSKSILQLIRELSYMFSLLRPHASEISLLSQILIQHVGSCSVEPILEMLLAECGREHLPAMLHFPRSIIGQPSELSLTLDKYKVSLREGLSLSTWIKIQNYPRRCEEQVLSIHAGSHLGWRLLINDGRILLKAFNPENDSGYFQCCLPSVKVGEFFHVSLSVVYSDANGFRVQASVAGHSFTRPVHVLQKMADEDIGSALFTVYIGQPASSFHPNQPHYWMTHIIGLLGVLNPSSVVTLCSLGPFYRGVVQTVYGEVNLRPAYFLQQHVYQKIDDPMLQVAACAFEAPSKWVTNIQRAAHFIILCDTPDQVCYIGHRLSHDSVQAVQPVQFELKPFKYTDNLVSVAEHCWNSAFEAIGGLAYFIALFAESVNARLKGCRENGSVRIPAKCLRLLITFSRRYSQLDAPDQKFLHDIIARIPFVADIDDALDVVDIFEVVFHCCFIHLGDSAPNDGLDNTNVVLKEPGLFLSILENTQLWTSVPRMLQWKKLLCLMRNSIKEPNIDFPKDVQELNVTMWRQNDALYRILQVVSKFLSSNEHSDVISFHANITKMSQLWYDPDDTNSLSHLVVDVVKRLLVPPAEVPSLKTVWEFLIQTHPPADTFVRDPIFGYHPWLHPDIFTATSEDFPLPGESTSLSETMSSYFDSLGEEFLQHWFIVDKKLSSLRNAIQQQNKPEDEEAKLTIDYSLCHNEQGDEERSSSGGYTPSTLVRSFIFDLLAETISFAPDSVIHCLLHDVISWQAILVMLTGQNSTLVWESVLDLMDSFLRRAPDFTKAMYVRFSGHRLLSSQLGGCNSSVRLADAAFSMMLGERVYLTHGLDSDKLRAVPVNQLSCDACHIVLRVFVESTHDWALCGWIGDAIAKVYEHSSQLRAALIDCGLVDCLVLVVDKASFCQTVNKERWNDTNCALQSLISTIVRTGAVYCDDRMFAACKRLVTLLCLLEFEVSQSEMSEEKSQRLDRVREFLCCVLREWLSLFTSLNEERARSASQDSLSDWQFLDNEDDSLPGESIVDPSLRSMDGTSPMAAYVSGQFADIKERMAKIGTMSRSILKCKYPRRSHPPALGGTGRLSDSVTFAIDHAVAVLTMMDPTANARGEATVLEFTLQLLSEAFVPNNGLELWRLVHSGAVSRAKKALLQLTAFTLYPAAQYRRQWIGDCAPDRGKCDHWAFKKRIEVLTYICEHMVRTRSTLRNLLKVSMDEAYTMCLGIFDLAFLSNPTAVETRSDLMPHCDIIAKFIIDLKERSPFDFLTSSKADAVNALVENEKLAAFSFENERSRYLSVLHQEAINIAMCDQTSRENLTSMAMKLTTEVVEQTTLARKVLTEAPRAIIRRMHAAEDRLLAFSSIVPSPLGPVISLDPCEGPNRERRRMVRSATDIPQKFFRMSLDTTPDEAFDRVLRTGPYARQPGDLTVIDAYKFHCDVVEVRGPIECEGDLVVARENVHILVRSIRTTHKQVPQPQVKYGGVRIPYEQILEIWDRKYLLQDVALELFLKDGSTHMLVFKDRDREEFRMWLEKLDLASVFVNKNKVLQAATEQWRRGAKTNFEYLMILNKVAGRTYNDLMQYPVFPFVLSCYNSASLDLADPNQYRDFSRPMAVQDRNKEKHYVVQYETLREQRESMGPYHYGSHYSNSGIVAHFLVRLLPFTKLALEYQDGSFDLPDRLFNSIDAIWRLASSDSTSDFKELIPEFFYLPDFLQNKNKLQLGRRQNNELVDHVQMPSWVGPDDFRLFTIVHRQALESAHVSSKLHLWIDLIFGYKQSGEAARDALNVFHPATYTGSSVVSPGMSTLDQDALATMVRTYGQMPTQLFFSPHQPQLVKLEQTSIQLTPLPQILNVRLGELLTSQLSVGPLSVPFGQQISRLCVLPDGVLCVAGPRTAFAYKPEDRKTDSRFFSSSRPTWCGVFGLNRAIGGSAILSFRTFRADIRGGQLECRVNAIDTAFGCGEITNLVYSQAGLLFLGYDNGLVRGYSVKFSEKELESISYRSSLIFHSSPISVLVVNDEFSIVVTSCGDQTAVWDRNSLNLLFTIPAETVGKVSCVCVSDISGDIALASLREGEYKISLFSIGGDFIVSSRSPARVCSLAMSSYPDGTAVNVIVTGCADSTIRFYDLWTLKDCKKEHRIFASDRHSIVSIAFAPCHRRIYCASHVPGHVSLVRIGNDSSLPKSICAALY